eukprot:gene13338-14653_t
MKTKNEFAIVLIFYYHYFRNRIELDSLKKVVVKYTKKQFQGQLLKDLYQKYPAHLFEHLLEVDYSEVIYVLRKYSQQIPKEYLQLIIKDYETIASKPLIIPPYDESTDIYSNNFNAANVLTNPRQFPLCCPPYVEISLVYDNLTKVSHLLPSYTCLTDKLEGSLHKLVSVPEGFRDETAEEILNRLLAKPSQNYINSNESETIEEEKDAVEEEDNTNNWGNIKLTKSLETVFAKRSEEIEKELIRKKTIQEQEKRPFLDILAEKSVPRYISINSLGEKTALDSPLSLINQFYREKLRVRIITRHQNSIRGSIDAFIIGFDKFMNLILKDCDEEYVITTQQKKRKKVMKLGKFVDRTGVLIRYLPQVILRGDNIVCVFRLLG